MARRWWQTPPSLDDLLLMAHFELLTNPTITSYEFVDGEERRRFVGNPFARITVAFKRLGEAATQASGRMLEFVKAFEAEQERRNLYGESAT